MRKSLVIGNWKQNGDVAGVKALAESVAASCVDELVEVAVCPAALHLALVAPLLGDAIGLGAQDVSEYTGGAYTGQLSPGMLSEIGCKFAIVGHSERREYCAESNEAVGRKAKSALDAGLVPVVCVGEKIEQRENGDAETVVAEQLAGLMSALSSGDLSKCVIAYEPVWAIGTGLVATVDQVGAMHAEIRAQLDKLETGSGQVVQVLYGGSVKPSNATEVFALPDVDGGLIGGAALVSADFAAIVAAASSSGE